MISAIRWAGVSCEGSCDGVGSFVRVGCMDGGGVEKRRGRCEVGGQVGVSFVGAVGWAGSVVE